MRLLYSTMGLTFLIINIAYAMVIPSIIMFLAPHIKNMDLDEWKRLSQIASMCRHELSFIWLIQFLLFLYKVSPNQHRIMRSEAKLSTESSMKSSTRQLVFSTPEKAKKVSLDMVDSMSQEEKQTIVPIAGSNSY